MRRRGGERRRGSDLQVDTSNLGTAGSGADYASDDENAVIFARPIAPIPSTKDITDKLTIRLTQPGEDVDTVISLDPSTEDPVLVVAAQPVANVIAPATLPEHYSLPVTLGGRTFLATVPKGGVAIGQRFPVALPPETDVNLPSFVPVGYWKDGLLTAFFRHGFCHPTVCNSCCCLPIAVAQLSARLGLTWNGLESTDATKSKGVFQRWFRIVLTYWIYRVFWFFVCIELDPSRKSWFLKDGKKLFGGEYREGLRREQIPRIYWRALAFEDVVWFLYYGYIVACILRRVRSYVRAKYHIPKTTPCPGNVEDCCCATVCSCFVAAQILRHTTDYNEFSGKCCTEKGVRSDVPLLV